VLLLIVATWRFDVINNCLALIAFKTSANTVNVNTFLSYSNCSKCLRLHVLSQPFSKTRTALCDFFVQKLYCILFWWSFQKASCFDPKTWGHSTGRIKFGELGGHCFFRIILDSSHAGIVERHVLCAQSPVHLAKSAAPSGSSRLQSSINYFGSVN